MRGLVGAGGPAVTAPTPTERTHKQRMVERARKGGQGLAAKHAHDDYMSRLGAKGAQKFYTLYEWQPTGTSQFALVRKSDSIVIAFSDGSPATRRNKEAVQ